MMTKKNVHTAIAGPKLYTRLYAAAEQKLCVLRSMWLPESGTRETLWDGTFGVVAEQRRGDLLPAVLGWFVVTEGVGP